MRTIIYPGTFDPITLGHINLLERAAKLADKLIIAIAFSEKKSPMFTFEERVDLVKESCAHLDNIEVIGFKGLIVDVAKNYEATAVLRGVRNATDFDYEIQMAHMNHHLHSDFETLFLTPANEYAYISSTLVREISTMKGDVSQLVSEPVLKALQQKLSN